MNLYTFTEPNAVRRYTSSKTADVVTVNGMDYEWASIRRSNYNHDVLSKKTNITIITPERGVLHRYLAPQSQIVSVTIATMSGTVFWRGRMASIATSGGGFREVQATFVAESLTPILHERRIYQRTCPYELYGRNCQALKFPKALRVISVAEPNTLVLDNVAGEIKEDEQNHYIGGLVEYNDRNWWISNLSYNAPMDTMVTAKTFGEIEGAIAANAQIKILKGCNRTINDCQDIHHNVSRFGAWNFVYTSPFNNAISGA